MKRWVCGFIFYGGMVALLGKKHGPEVVVGKMNGIGGKIEEGETPLQAMHRECKEETGVEVWLHQWRYMGELNLEEGGKLYGTVHFFEAECNVRQRSEIKGMEDEEIMWVETAKLKFYNVVPNLHWLIPLAQDRKVTFIAKEKT